MPTYEYRCPNGHEFEKFFRTISSATTENACPTCGLSGVRQMSSGAGLMFKGSGFYLTDYGKNAHANKGPAPKPADATTSGDASSATPAGSTGGAGSSGDAGGSTAAKGDAPAAGGSAKGTSDASAAKPDKKSE